MSLVKANTFQDATGGSNAVFSGVASPPNSMGFRNRIINGDMRIDQRNAGASVAAAGYTLDRWVAFESTSATSVTAQRSTTAPAGFTNSLLYTVGTGGSAGASEQAVIRQRLEGNNVSDLAFGTASAQSITVSFRVRSSVTGTYSVAIQNSAGDRSYVATYTVDAANTWETKSVTIPGDTSGTWLTDSGIGMAALFDLGSGSGFNTTAGAWAAGDFRKVSGQANVIGTTGATFYITGVQLEAGTVASPFERVEYGAMLRACQRYFAKTFDQSVAVSASTGSRAGSIPFFFWTTASTNAETAWQLPAEMRASPTVTSYAWTGGSANWANNAGGTVGIGTLRSGTRNVGLTVGGSVGASEQFWIHATVSAEL